MTQASHHTPHTTHHTPHTTHHTKDIRRVATSVGRVRAVDRVVRETIRHSAMLYDGQRHRGGTLFFDSGANPPTTIARVRHVYHVPGDAL